MRSFFSYYYFLDLFHSKRSSIHVVHLKRYIFSQGRSLYINRTDRPVKKKIYITIKKYASKNESDSVGPERYTKPQRPLAKISKCQ